MNPFPTYTEACTAVCASKQLEVPGSLRFATHNIFGAWRSPVAHLLWEPLSGVGRRRPASEMLGFCVSCVGERRWVTTQSLAQFVSEPL